MKTGKEWFLTPGFNDNTVYRRKIIEQIGHLSGQGILFVHPPAGCSKSDGKDVAVESSTHSK